jgi:cell division protein FtsW (lipid II flippase)
VALKISRFLARGKRAGCFGYGENKQKGDNEGGYLPSQHSKLVFIIPNENIKSILFLMFFIIFFCLKN